MGLHTCEECGYKKVADDAKTCPECGTANHAPTSAAQVLAGIVGLIVFCVSWIMSGTFFVACFAGAFAMVATAMLFS